jgi:hypothetical protein
MVSGSPYSSQQRKPHLMGSWTESLIAMRLSACGRRHGVLSACREGHAGMRYGIVTYVHAVYLCCEPRLIIVRHQIALS